MCVWVCGERGRQHPTSAPSFDQNEHPFVSSAALDPKDNESSDEHAGEPWAWEVPSSHMRRR